MVIAILFTGFTLHGHQNPGRRTLESPRSPSGWDQGDAQKDGGGFHDGNGGYGHRSLEPGFQGGMDGGLHWCNFRGPFQALVSRPFGGRSHRDFSLGVGELLVRPWEGGALEKFLWDLLATDVTFRQALLSPMDRAELSRNLNDPGRGTRTLAYDPWSRRTLLAGQTSVERDQAGGRWRTRAAGQTSVGRGYPWGRVAGQTSVGLPPAVEISKSIARKSCMCIGIVHVYRNR